MAAAESNATERPALDVLLIRVEHELYALPSASVREVARYRTITAVPGAPRSLPGIISQRGTILAVVDLRLTLDLGLADVTRASRLVIVAHQEIDMALLVDAVLDLATIPSEQIELVPAALDPARARFLTGIVQLDGEPVALLDLGELIASLREWS
jgi:purine-binding chemotaxis protein CheW